MDALYLLSYVGIIIMINDRIEFINNLLATSNLILVAGEGFEPSTSGL
jgi:hypothetical protein